MYSAVSSVQFSSAQSLDRLGRRRDMGDDSAEILFQSFFFFFCRRPLWAVLAWSGMSTLQGALKDGFGEAVVACDMPEPREFPSLADLWMSKQFMTHDEAEVTLRLLSKVSVISVRNYMVKCIKTLSCQSENTGPSKLRPCLVSKKLHGRVHKGRVMSARNYTVKCIETLSCQSEITRLST